MSTVLVLTGGQESPADILPSLTLLFWGAGCLVRSLVMLAAPYKP